MLLVAVQPSMSLSDYVSGAAFERKLDSLESQVRAQAGVQKGETTLVVFPEMIGTFLMLAGESVAALRTVNQAIARTALRHRGAVLDVLLHTHARSISRAVLFARARVAERLYTDAFARTARRLRAHIVAGSALLPDADDPVSGRVFNTSLHFDPDGRVVARTRKVNLVPELETDLGIASGDPGSIARVEVAGHRVATLICYDGFHEPHTHDEPRWTNVAARAVTDGADVLAQPAANPWPWDRPWIHNEPGESMLRREQWRREGLVGQLPRLEGARFAITAHLVARFLDVAFEGRSEIVERRADGTVAVLAEAERATAEAVLVARVR